MKKLLFILIITSIFACHNNQQSKFKEVSTEQFRGLDSLIKNYVDSAKISGAVALIAQKGKIKYHKAFGYSNIEKQKRQKISDIFRMASMTKPITSVAAMILYEEGKFKLEDPLSKFIPEFSNPQVLDTINKKDTSFTAHPANNKILIKHLFTHSSGIPYGFDDETLIPLWEKAGISEGFEERDIILADNILKLAKMPLMHEPGERYTYGLGLDVMGRLIEIWSGKPLDVFFKERIFEPLGMEDSYFYLPEEKYDRLPEVYMSVDSGIAETNYPLIHYPVRGAKTFFSGGADLSATAYDYFLFSQMMLNNGELNGVRILKPETVKLMTSTHLETGDDDMGLGLGVLSAKTTSKQARSVGSFNWGGFFATTFWVDPQEEIVAILLLQMYPYSHWDIQTKFEDLTYKSIAKETNPN